jgi:putative transposase
METGQIYHVFNHANGWENLFNEPRNYHLFLEKMDKFLTPVIDIYAHCLMPNHFHLAAAIPDIKELVIRDPDFMDLSEEQAGKKISKNFSNLFSSYTQTCNKQYNRMGSLFVPNMKVKKIEDEGSLCKVIHYIHSNPVHHGFTNRIEDWPFSSYNSFISKTGESKVRESILSAFGGLKYFLEYHKQPITIKIKTHKEEKDWIKFGMSEELHEF